MNIKEVLELSFKIRDLKDDTDAQVKELVPFLEMLTSTIRGMHPDQRPLYLDMVNSVIHSDMRMTSKMMVAFLLVRGGVAQNLPAPLDHLFTGIMGGFIEAGDVGCLPVDPAGPEFGGKEMDPSKLN